MYTMARNNMIFFVRYFGKPCDVAFAVGSQHHAKKKIIALEKSGARHGLGPQFSRHVALYLLAPGATWRVSTCHVGPKSR